MRIAEYFRYFGGAADKLAGETLPIDKPDLFVYTRRVPIGVVAAVVPWNSQMFLSATKIAPALAADVLKAATPVGRLVAEAGIPDGVVNIVTGHAEPCGRALTTHPLVAKIACGPRAAATQCGGEQPRARRQIAVHRLRGRRPKFRRERLRSRHLRGNGAELCRRFSSLCSRVDCGRVPRSPHRNRRLHPSWRPHGRGHPDGPALQSMCTLRW